MEATTRDRAAGRWRELQAELCEWLTRLPKPVGITPCNDVRARHVLEACRSLGLVVPRDVTVLVVEADLPLKAIAARTDFKSVQDMTTFLHRHMGLTPARLRSVERPSTGSASR